MAKEKTAFFCTSCGGESPRWQGIMGLTRRYWARLYRNSALRLLLIIRANILRW